MIEKLSALFSSPKHTLLLLKEIKVNGGTISTNETDKTLIVDLTVFDEKYPDAFEMIVENLKRYNESLERIME